jgi:hypothetical protein
MDHLKDPLFSKLSQSQQDKIFDALMQSGKGLPCHVTAVNGALITVAFDINSIFTLPQITVPLFGPEYIRYPIKAGDLGTCVASDACLSYTSGQGGGLADLSAPANLEALYFQPIGNKNWVGVNPQQVTIYAPQGCLIRDTANDASINLTPGNVTVTIGSTTFVLTGSSITATTSTFTINAPTIVLNGNLTQGTEGGGYPATLQGPITVIHELTANNHTVSAHTHGGVTTGGGDTGTPIG